MVYLGSLDLTLKDLTRASHVLPQSTDSRHPPFSNRCLLKKNIYYLPQLFPEEFHVTSNTFVFNNTLELIDIQQF